MIIGIDAREGVKKQRAGKGEYVYQIVSGLIKHSEHQFVLFLDQDPLPEWRKDNVKFIIFKTAPFAWQLRVFLYLEFLHPVDIYFSTTSVIVPALIRSIPVVTVLFDFVSFLFPQHHDRKAVVLEKFLMKWAVRFSKKLIAISEHTKKDAVGLFKINPNKIFVTHLAPSLSDKGEEIEITGKDIILFIGTLEPRKNIVRLVEAFNKLRGDGIESALVLVGKWGWQSGAIKQSIENSLFKNDIQVLGYIKDANKNSLYKQATVFAFPSLYEGFGLPPLEAMANGTPVITSNVSSLPEVVGDAAMLVNPQNTEEIYQALRKILTNKEFANQLANKGYAQVQKFTWENTIQKTLDILTF